MNSKFIQICKLITAVVRAGVILSLCLGINGTPAAHALEENTQIEPSMNSSLLDGQQAISHSGWFSIIWGDSQAGVSQTVYTLTDDRGHTTLLSLDDTLAQPAGGVLSLNRKYVTVQGVWATPRSAQGMSTVLNVTSVYPAQSPGTKALGGDALSAVSGSQPWISIMCKFSDISAEPKDLNYFLGMYSSSYPGLDHYWREVSYNNINLVGSSAVGWYTLPEPRSSYFFGTYPEFDKAARDCTAAADADVDFTNYAGINLMFNDGGFCNGGSWFMTLDGESKYWRVTWESLGCYNNISMVAHEMGHGFGFPHSSGNYGQTYDNVWDVMSNSEYNCAITADPEYGCLPQHTISYHLDMLGWIPATQIFTAGPNTNTTITLEQLALPQTSNYKMAQIPIDGSTTHFYTVEARRLSGYDVKLPGNAVVIHEIDTTRTIPAHVIDIDQNGDTWDAGAMWTVGETFSDPANGISVYIASATATGFQIKINTLPFWTISGYTRTSTGTGVAGVTMLGLPHSTITDTNGFYSDRVVNGWSGAVTPGIPSYVFTPFNIGYTNIISDLSDQNYTGTYDDYTGTYFVKPVASGTGTCQSWNDACTLQHTLITVASHDEIWAAAGTYTPGISRTDTFQLKYGVAVYGGFAGTETKREQRDPLTNLTILSGDLNRNDNSNLDFAEPTRLDNSYHVVIGADDAILDGFIIMAGNANANNDTSSFYTSRGGGMYNVDVSPTLTNIIFSDNTAIAGGGIFNYFSDPNIMNVTFTDNMAVGYGGGMWNYFSNPDLTNITFSNNSANDGGGMQNYFSNPDLINITFSNNSADDGGGGMQNYFSNPDLTNITFSNNSTYDGGGMLNISSDPQIRNTIFWGNHGGPYFGSINQISNYESTPSVNYSVVQGGYAGGTHIITTNPLLGPLGNYGGFTQTIPLLVGSSAIDTGDDTICPATDQRGITRPQGVRCDIGAFEGTIYPIYLPQILR